MSRRELPLRVGIVSLDGEICGRIEETAGGSRFSYTPQWVARRDAAAISQTMPVRAESYEGRGLLPFFENLLPEGWLFDIAVTKLKIAKDDAFGLLLATCADCVGAVEVRPERAAP